ncbi:MAG: hypothetical protein ACQGVC_12855 [Myxococcota bacterium]
MRKALGIVAGLGFLGALVWVTTQQMQVTCEVCMAHRGRQVCETATTASRDDALAQARSSACSRLSSGVTDGIQCNGRAPVSVTCSE